MTSLLPKGIRVIGDAGSHAALIVDVVVIVLLVFLLLEQEMLRAYFARTTHRPKELGLAIVPLMIAFTIIIATRWSEL